MVSVGVALAATLLSGAPKPNDNESGVWSAPAHLSAAREPSGPPAPALGKVAPLPLKVAPEVVAVGPMP
jgi:hypothetical protein